VRGVLEGVARDRGGPAGRGNHKKGGERKKRDIEGEPWQIVGAAGRGPRRVSNGRSGDLQMCPAQEGVRGRKEKNH